MNNYLNNTLNANIKNYNNIWNTTKTEGKNIIDGPYLAGNFWAEPDGSGFSENAEDADLDCIADTQYNGTNFTDYLPLVLISTKEKPILPVANFSANTTEGYIPLDVQFTDLSENVTSWNWNFGDESSSNEQSPEHTYSSSGNYTVNLTASNVNGTDSKLATITVLLTEPVLPVANFSSNVSEGYTPLSVQFNDSSLNATDWSWDFENDGIVNSFERNSSHIYSTAGTYTVNLTVSNDNGTDSTFANITVSEAPVLPVANFSSNPASGSAPLFVQFNDSSENATGWSWDFENNGTVGSTAQNSSYTYSVPGTYTVNLTVSNNNGTDSKLATITVSEAPVLPIANFSSNVNSGYAPLSVQFKDSSENAIVWNWDFGDGSNSTDKDPTHIFSAAGNYTVNLTVSNLNGADSKLSTIIVSEAPILPVANFSANKTEGYAPLDVQFTDLSENATEVSWDFENDGDIDSTYRNPIHEFIIPGNYTVNLTVSNANGMNSTFATITVLVKPEPVLPVADFSSNTTEGYAPLDVQFNDSSLHATGRYWDFGDGSNSIDQNPLHIFSTAGTYAVNLTVSNLNGTDSTESIITVYDEPVLPVANFSNSVAEGYAPLSVEFTDSSENATGWDWDFENDGIVDSTNQNPVHVFATAGNYTVNLTVSNLNGTDSTESIITVYDEPVLPVANFSSNISSGYIPLSVQFTDLSENLTDWNWDFGDGYNSTEKNPLHTYSASGTYTVNLTASNTNGTDSKLATITALEKPAPVLPIANFSTNTTEGYAPLDVQFTDLSENATEIIWDFGDITNSTEQNPMHTYSASGTYIVNLTASNVNGTNSTFATITVLVKPEPIIPVANFSSNVTRGYAPLSVYFTDLSENVTSWYWNFGDGSSSTKKNPVHTYSASGTYTVNLTASNTNGTDSKLATITVLEKPAPVLPVANFSANRTEGYAPFSVQFIDLSRNATLVSWDFENDGNTDSTDRNPIHEFTTQGTYTVNLIASNSNGTNSKLATITVLVKPESILPVANFSANRTEGYAPLSVQFTDLSENVTAWNWDFENDGDIDSTDRNPVYTFSASGTYTVNLTVSNANGTNSRLGTINILVKPESVLPVANFSTSVTGGYAPLSVTFTDLSKNAASISWDANSDGIEDSNASSFTYKYASAGTYTVKLTAINANGTDEKTVTIIVDKKGSGGRSRSSSGDGAGGSPEPAKNVEIKESSQAFITNGNHVKFVFPKNVTAVVYLSFDYTKKTVGKTTTIVEMLKNQSTLTTDAPQGEVYNYLNIWVGDGEYATEKGIENAIICFKVKKSWIEAKDINQSSIVLNRYCDKKWNELPTTLLGEDEKYLYFISETPGFSPFAITTKRIVIEVLPDTENSEHNENIESKIDMNFGEAENTSISQKENLNTPGFEVIYCIIGLLGVFLYRRR